jgi:hypothetical protein
MENTWMPKVAGILDIVAGSFGILISIFLPLWFVGFYYFMPSDASELHEFPMQLMAVFMTFWAVFVLAAGIVAIVGGINALRKKSWRLVLAGSIAAFFGSSTLGVAAIIFTVLSKSQFE